jgi:hypothetical protein
LYFLHHYIALFLDLQWQILRLIPMMTRTFLVSARLILILVHQIRRPTTTMTLLMLLLQDGLAIWLLQW